MYVVAECGCGGVYIFLSSVRSVYTRSYAFHVVSTAVLRRDGVAVLRRDGVVVTSDMWRYLCAELKLGTE